MSEIITQEISDRICKHMNKDHGDALITYVKVFGKVDEVTSATMLSIDSQGMNLSVNGSDEQQVRIEFDHTLKDAADAHHTLVAMLKQTRTN